MRTQEVKRVKSLEGQIKRTFEVNKYVERTGGIYKLPVGGHLRVRVLIPYKVEHQSFRLQELVINDGDLFHSSRTWSTPGPVEVGPF